MTDSGSTTVDWLKVIVPAATAVIALGIGLWQYRATRWRQRLIDIQEGDKSAAGFVAVQLWAGRPKWLFWRRWPFTFSRHRKRRREELLQALCLATVFEKSGRLNSLIRAALQSQDRRYDPELREIMDRMTVAVTRNWNFTELETARRRLILLRMALGLDGETRVRLDRYALRAESAGEGKARRGALRLHRRKGPEPWSSVWPLRATDEQASDEQASGDHKRFGDSGDPRDVIDLRRLVERLGSIVVVSRTGPPAVVVAGRFDYSESAFGGETVSTADFLVSEVLGALRTEQADRCVAAMPGFEAVASFPDEEHRIQLSESDSRGIQGAPRRRQA